MTNGVPPQRQISPEEIESLQQVVTLATEGTISKAEALSRLLIQISSICAQRNIEFTPSLIRPYSEQLDADKRERDGAEQRGERSGGTRQRNDEDSDGDEGEGTDGAAAGGREQADEDDRGVNEEEDIGREDIGGRKRRETDDSEEEEIRTPKRRREYAWNDTDIIHATLLTPAHENVRVQVRLYNESIKDTHKDLECALSKPPLPDSFWKYVCLHKYVDLDEIASNGRGTLSNSQRDEV